MFFILFIGHYPSDFTWFFRHVRSQKKHLRTGFHVFLVLFSACLSTWWKILVLVNHQASLCIYSHKWPLQGVTFPWIKWNFAQQCWVETEAAHDLLRWYWRHISHAQQTYELILCFGVFNCFKYLLLDLCFTHLIYMVYFSFYEQIDNQTDSLPHWISFIYSLWTWLKSCQT